MDKDHLIERPGGSVGQAPMAIASARESEGALHGSKATVKCLDPRLRGQPPWQIHRRIYPVA
jgi:hypothetical protein